MIRQLPSPAFFNSFIILAIVMHFILPIMRIIHPPFTYLGLILILTGVILNVWATRTMKYGNTTIEYDEAPKKLIEDGPFKISRNPIYLSGVILSLGIAILLGSAITFIFPIMLAAILNYLYIPAEEMRLEKYFGQEYLNYKKQVRRWL